MGQKSAVSLVFDAGALIALERADARMRALCREILRTGARVVIPAAVLGQVYRDPSRQVALRVLLKARTTVVPPLDQALAEACGVLCGRTKTVDVIDASVALITRREGAKVITSDPDDLRHLDSELRIERI